MAVTQDTMAATLANFKSSTFDHFTLDIATVQIVIFHYKCADGFTAAYSIWRKIGTQAQYIRGVHNTEPDYQALQNQIVLLVDFTYPEAVLDRMAQHNTKVYVIDHHVTNTHRLHKLPASQVVMCGERSGAALAWIWAMNTPPPTLILLVEDIDMWWHRITDSKAFCTVYDDMAYTTDDFSRVKLLEDKAVLDQYIAGGRIILPYINCKVRELSKDCRITTSEFDNRSYRVGYVNSPLYKREICAVLLENPEIDIAVAFSGETVIDYSLRSRQNSDVDVSQIAKYYGGGGHKHASACQRVVAPVALPDY